MLFTADDAGASPQVNEAIRRACTEGQVNSVAYLVNLPWFEDAVDRLGGTGAQRSVHLNLVEGRPLALAADSPLVDGDGWFRRQSGGLLAAHYRAPATVRARIAADVRTEVAAQMTAFAEAFASDAPLAVDSHQHVHMFPFVLPEVLGAADDVGLPIARLRWPVERVDWHNGLGIRGSRHLPGGLAKALALRAMARRGHRRLAVELDRVGTLTGSFCGVMHTGHMTVAVARRFVDRIAAEPPRSGPAELLVHPGGADALTDAWRRSPALRDFYTSRWRARELALACDPTLVLPG